MKKSVGRGNGVHNELETQNTDSNLVCHLMNLFRNVRNVAILFVNE